MSNNQICVKCVMDESDPDIQFDVYGECNNCKRYVKRVENALHYDEEGQKMFDKIVAKIKKSGNNREYDCIVGVSGGVDSTMLAYTVKMKLGLRPLAVHIDNGWDAELAVGNIEKVLNKLDIELYTHVLNWEEFKNLQLSFLKASVINAEIPADHAFLSGLYMVAAKMNIQYVLWGSNVVTEAIIPKAWIDDFMDWKFIKGIQKIHGNVKLKHFPHLSLLRIFYYIFIKRIKFISPFNYIKYNKKEAMEVIKNELGWVEYGGKHHESLYTRFYQSYILPKKFKVDKRRAHLSSLVRSGQITRKEALEELEKDVYPDDLLIEEKEYLVKKLGLTEKEFDAIMNLPIKHFKDYPNNAFLFKQLSFLVKYARKVTTCK